jgi:tetratricopeptide (TPR) repeat protein
MFSLFFLGKFDEALKDIDTFVSDHKDSEYTLHALNFLADHYVSQKEYAKADATLQRVEEFYKTNKADLSKALLERANILLKSGNDKKATAIVDRIILEFSDQAIYIEALYLQAGIYSNSGNYLKAIEIYTLVSETAKDKFIKTAAHGRIGDCNFSLYSKQYNNEFLEKAIKMYTYVLEQRNITRDFRLQTLYKIGKCFDLLGFEKKAIKSYKELIYDYKSKPCESTLWFVKAANSLATLRLNAGTPEGGKAAIIIYRELIRNDIQPVEDYKTEILNIKRKYKL